MASEARYAAPARRLHWLTAAVIVAIGLSGLAITRLPLGDVPWRGKLYALHETLGVLLLFLALARVWVRLRHPPPPLPAGMPGAMRGAAHGVHLVLYGLMLSLPVIGYVATDAGGNHIKLFGLLTLPSPVGKDEALAARLVHLHFVGTLTLLGLVAVHVLAVAFHAVVRRDGVLRRMA